MFDTYTQSTKAAIAEAFDIDFENLVVLVSAGKIIARDATPLWNTCLLASILLAGFSALTILSIGRLIAALNEVGAYDASFQV